jgi:hypothetical protein
MKVFVGRCHAVSRCSLVAVAAAGLLLPERFSRCCPLAQYCRGPLAVRTAVTPEAVFTVRTCRHSRPLYRPRLVHNFPDHEPQTSRLMSRARSGDPNMSQVRGRAAGTWLVIRQRRSS